MSAMEIVFISLMHSSVQTAGADELVPRGIAVVRTWDDLLKTVPITTPDGIDVRIGMEAVECPANSAVLMYCLTDGFTTPETWSSFDQVGPFTLYVPPFGSGWRFGFGWFGLGGRPECKGTLLFTKPIVVVPRGRRNGHVDDRVHIIVRGADNRAAASTDLRIVADQYHSWSPLAIQGGERITVSPDADRGACLPQWFGVRPIVFRGTEDEQRVARLLTDSLPRFIATEPSLRLRLDGRTLVVTSESFLIVTDWGMNFVARWWVNGRPYIPDGPEGVSRHAPHSAVAPSEFGRMLNTIKVNFSCDPGVLHAKVGDKIGVQLLYCDDGWDWVSEEITWAPKSWRRRVAPAMTDKIEFVAW
jgi:hypothetical protein